MNDLNGKARYDDTSLGLGGSDDNGEKMEAF